MPTQLQILSVLSNRAIEVSLGLADTLDQPRQMRAMLVDAVIVSLGYRPGDMTSEGLARDDDSHGGCSAPASANGSLAPWQLRRIRATASARLGRNIPIPELAKACRLSPGHFARAFKQSTGLPPHRWTVQLRVALVKDLAYRTGLCAEDLAAACGFVDPSHLNRWFRRFTGISLGAWQRASAAQGQAIAASGSSTRHRDARVATLSD